MSQPKPQSREGVSNSQVLFAANISWETHISIRFICLFPEYEAIRYWVVFIKTKFNWMIN